MKMSYAFSIVLCFLMPFLSKAQKPSDFLPEKPGKWSYSSNVK
jgi:hypothetical protein